MLSNVEVIKLDSPLYAQVGKIALLFIIFKTIRLSKKGRCYCMIWEVNGTDMLQIKLLLSQYQVNSLRSKRPSTIRFTLLKKPFFKH